MANELSLATALPLYVIAYGLAFMVVVKDVQLAWQACREFLPCGVDAWRVWKAMVSVSVFAYCALEISRGLLGS